MHMHVAFLHFHLKQTPTVGVCLKNLNSGSPTIQIFDYVKQTIKLVCACNQNFFEINANLTYCQSICLALQQRQ